MKRSLLRPLLVALLFAPSIVSGQILECLDAETRTPIPFVLAYNLDSSQTAVADSSGKIDLSGFAFSDEIIFTHAAYSDGYLNKADLQEKGFKILMVAKRINLPTVKISATGMEDDPRLISETVTLIPGQRIESSNAGTPAELLEREGQVAVQKSQGGGGSPIIRSFEANKILLMIDGVRMNNAIYRGGHLQNSITLDENILAKLEVIQGPGTPKYGSDAIGGVIHFYTKNPLTLAEGAERFTALAKAQLSTANLERTGHLDFSLAFEHWSSLTSVTYSEYGDIVQGRVRSGITKDLGLRTFYVERLNGKDSAFINPDPAIQIGSAYEQLDLLQKIRVVTKKDGIHTFNLQHSSSSNIDRYDRLSLLDADKPAFAEWYYGPQRRQLLAYTFQKEIARALFDKIESGVSFQNIDESRVTRKFSSTRQNNRQENVKLAGAYINASKEFLKGHILTGAEIYQNWVSSTAYMMDIESEQRFSLDTRYPNGGSSLLTYGIFVSGRRHLSEKVNFNGGIRFSGQNLEARVISGDEFPFLGESFRNSNWALNGSLGLNFSLNSNTTFKLRTSNGFRAPNLDDVSKVFESIPGFLVLPNEDLVPEYIYNFELSILRSNTEKLEFGLLAYYNIISRLIVRTQSTYNGMDSVFYDGETLAILKNQNLGNARALGIQGSMKASITNTLSTRFALSYNYGQIISAGIPLDHVPPIYGNAAIEYEGERTRFAMYAHFNGAKKMDRYNILGSDKFEFATADGLPFWYTLNASVSQNIAKGLDLDIRLENIFDLNYRTFASGISAPGRNLILRIRMSI